MLSSMIWATPSPATQATTRVAASLKMTRPVTRTGAVAGPGGTPRGTGVRSRGRERARTRGGQRRDRGDVWVVGVAGRGLVPALIAPRPAGVSYGQARRDTHARMKGAQWRTPPC